ncbi:MAG TPA: L,D-transpeptidase family protein [Candidatus Cloacimonadota bacterium]|nr:L,D-transpeptidase family protein [Candidatus Cloacimonadota bacterium]
MFLFCMLLGSPTPLKRDIDPEGMDAKDLLTWAESGNREAQFQLGVRFYTGKDQPQDIFEAMRWLNLASRQGCSGADFYLDQLEYNQDLNHLEVNSSTGYTGNGGYLSQMRILVDAPLVSILGPKTDTLSVIVDTEKLLEPEYNHYRWKDIRIGALNVQRLVNAVRFQNAPKEFTLIIDKDSAYSFLVENKTETILSASPVNVGALHNNVTNYLSSGSGIHRIRTSKYFANFWGSYGSGGLLIDNDRYLNGSDAFIAIHGTNQESWLLMSKTPEDRYLTHGCVRVLDKTLKQYISLYRANKLDTAIYVPFSSPTGTLTQNAYTRTYFGKWKDMRMGTGGPTLTDIINDLKVRWRTS